MSDHDKSPSAIHGQAPSWYRKPDLLPNESASDYEALYEALRNEVKPNGAFEELELSEFVFLAWEIARLRHYQTSILKGNIFLSIVQLFDEAKAAESYSFKTYKTGISGDQQKKKKKDDMLPADGVTEEIVAGRAFTLSAPALAPLERMMARRAALIEKWIEKFRERAQKAASAVSHATASGEATVENPALTDAAPPVSEMESLAEASLTPMFEL